MMRDLICKWFGPTKPCCQSCGSFISCCMNQVKECPKLRRSWPDRLWRWLRSV